MTHHDYIELPNNLGSHFGCRFTFTMDLSAGNHNFEVESNDGAMLYQGDQMLVNNDGMHTCRSKSESRWVSGNSFKVVYFQHGGTTCLSVKIDGQRVTANGVSPPIP